mmetsp:Transcript_4686/g.8727  ORF Transcript_4686/g.8727 Transcript_4686/m.8727 type:complete len:290 (-) Transcript_4686:399-1268(-)|eukprot:CAMPEP_0183708752 /NCGR_PEP_ID=MMETSP0737-20130205/4963_1 /TAXON_ID=385413 /ORGANISM="Thalassiosira miniscula, Strain CCMP1093" /LENGTH=289 /DNA_ID=CAMNT_0025936681 /DNA_START=203 /DNA_END=1072 /DNA_ORIENTATION=+
MARSKNMMSRAFLLVMSISQLALSLSLSSHVPTAAILALSLVPFPLAAADEADATADATADAANAEECTEPGTCSSDDSDTETASTAVDDTSSESQETNNSEEESTESSEPRATTGPTGNRLIFAEELATHIGEGGASPSNPIWLSILGKVYDVTTGEDFYGAEKGGYRFYSGRDASPCFSTGNNTPEGADENLDEWEDKKLIAAYEWSVFYEDHETYQYLGDFAGSKYFDAQGNELDYRKNIVSRSKEAKKIMDEEKERKKAERIKARKERKAENERKAREKANQNKK